MPFPRKLVFSCLALTAFAAFHNRASAAVDVVVGSCTTGLLQFSTIQAAVAAAPPGSTVEVCPGTYPEQVLIDHNLTLTGIQSGTSDNVIIVPPAGGLTQNGVDIFGGPVAAQIFVTAATKVKVTRLTVDGTGNDLGPANACGGPTLVGIYAQNSSATISNNAVRNQYLDPFASFGGCQNGLAILVEGLTSANTISIINNSVRAYQKNGITVNGPATGVPGPTVSIYENQITGFAATAMNWPGGAAENGIQLSYGATGKIVSNIVNDNIWYNDDSTQPYNAASGILVYASSGNTISNNRVGSAQFAITVDSDPTLGAADGNKISFNKVTGTQIFDGIDLCSDSNIVTGNAVYGSTEAAVHIDSTCTSSNGATGNNNTVTGNQLHEACAGVLLGSGTGNVFSPNLLYNLDNTSLAGDVCPAATATASSTSKLVARHVALRPSPYNPHGLSK